MDEVTSHARWSMVGVPLAGTLGEANTLCPYNLLSAFFVDVVRYA